MLGDSVRRRLPKRHMERESREPRERGSWKRRLLTLAGVLLIPFAIGYLVAVYVWFPPTAVSDGGSPVPDLIGLTISEAQRELVAARLGDIATTELPHPEIEAGRIIAQSPLPGQQLRDGAGVRVGLSSGRARVVLPDVLGFSADRAESMLTRAGFQVTRAQQESAAEAGQVIRTDPEPGQQRTLPATVTLIVSSGPPAEPEPGAFPDTTTIPPPR
jgi:eukaryotic-like serine/threonine-protein kinase